jgi:superfamily II DNA/RNA helicase
MFLKKLSPALQMQLDVLGFDKATPFQKQMISSIKSGADVLVAAPEQSGKSTALVLALLQMLQQAVDDTPRVLILTHGDSGVHALKKIFSFLGKDMSVRVVAATERGNILEQKDAIYFGSDIVISTPKRASELLSIEGINLISMKMLCLHQAQKILRNELLTLCYRVSESFPKAQFVVCGEQIGTYEERFQEQYMKPPVVVEQESAIAHPIFLPEEA